MIPISKAARQFQLSRSTLLYYDRVGLVRPSYRTAAGYRLYREDDLERLAIICRYRAAGMSLEAIKRLLEPDAGATSAVRRALHDRLAELNREIGALRRQQQVIFNLLGPEVSGDSRAMTKQQWVALLREIGLSESEMHAWHVAFERRSPEAHQDFLESLGLDAAEIKRIRAHSRVIDSAAGRSRRKPAHSSRAPRAGTKKHRT